MAARVLVIEDDEHVAQMLAEVLRGEGYDVVGLRCPELVLEVVDHERPDLILTDIMLPRTSGIDVADRLWINGFGTIPMIATSASGIMLDLARQMPFFQAVLPKPFDVDALLEEVYRVLVTNDPALEPSTLGASSRRERPFACP